MILAKIHFQGLFFRGAGLFLRIWKEIQEKLEYFRGHYTVF